MANNSGFQHTVTPTFLGYNPAATIRQPRIAPSRMELLLNDRNQGPILPNSSCAICQNQLLDSKGHVIGKYKDM
jgi:hypothetical protein